MHLLLRLLTSIFYAVLLFSLSGMVDVARAVTCSDVVSPQANYRYNETLYAFKYFNGKTYAVALSGATGRASLPDSYFSFSPNFTREYTFGGADSVSLKARLASGMYGSAKPVSITSDAVKDFILKQYGPYLSSSATLIDAWKEYGGTAPFTAIGGAPLAYTQWAVPPAPSAAPSAVSMDSSGKWVPVNSGTFTSQIVEFDGKLDCAVDPSIPYNPPPPPPVDPDASALNDLAKYNGQVCMADLNSDGDLSGPSEIKKCQVTAQGNYCPLGALQCNTSYQPPSCPPGSALNTSTDMCEANAVTTCPSTGGYVANPELCYKDAYKGCPGGYQYVAARNRCEATPTCASGNYNPATNKCETLDLPAACYSGNVRKVWNQPKGPGGNPLTTYDDLRIANGVCWVLRNEGFAPQIDPTLASATTATAISTTCADTAPGTACDGRHNGSWGSYFCESSAGTGLCEPSTGGSYIDTITCDYSLSTCQTKADVTKTWIDPRGPNGNALSTYDDLRDPNWACGVLATEGAAPQIDPKLATATSWSATAYQCYAPGEVATFDQRHNGSWATSGSGGAGWCSTGIKSLTCSYKQVCSDSPVNSCSPTVTSFANPTCPGGSFDSSNDVCYAAYTPSCTDPAFVVQVPGQPDLCQSAAIHTCPAGTAWVGLPVAKCQAVPVCAGAVYYDNATHACLVVDGCPYGNQYTCMQPAVGSPFMCSPHACEEAKNATDTGEKMDESYLQNDGARDADGNCLGQTYIFSGKPSRCRPPGWTVGYINNCCGDGTKMGENTGGGSGGGVLGMTSDIYKGIKGAYQAYQGYQEAASLIERGADAVAMSQYLQSQTATLANAVQAGEMSMEAANATYNGASAAVQGASQSATMASEALSSMGPAIAVYATGAIVDALGGDQDVKMIAQAAMTLALMSGPQAIIGVIVIVVMRFLMGSGCDSNDIITANGVVSDRCHYIGDYCEKKIFGMCVQKAKGHCCFNSVLARIINEQGRPQLASFQPDTWGPANQPNCRGFTPDEFQSIDFARIDLSEYFTTIQQGMNDQVKNAQGFITDTITNRVKQNLGNK